MCLIFVLERVFACSQDLKIKKDDVTRCTVQKSVCILSSLVSDIVQCIWTDGIKWLVLVYGKKKPSHVFRENQMVDKSDIVNREEYFMGESRQLQLEHLFICEARVTLCFDSSSLRQK